MADYLDTLLAARAAAAPQADPLDAMLATRAQGGAVSAAPAPQAAPTGMAALRAFADPAFNYDPTNANAGAIRGAASIGSTLLRPFESAADNAQRRSDVDAALTDLTGSDPNSTQYKTTKLATEVLGTSGVGGLVAKGLRLIPGAAKALPTLLPAIESGGMNANGATGLYGAANRVAGGAVSGATTAGAVDPQNASAGMMIGAAMPPVVQIMGAAGQKIGQAVNERLAEALRNYEKNSTLNDTVKQSIDAGYVIPPATVNPSFFNRVLESISGKQATQQLASAQNAETTDSLIRGALNLPDSAALNTGTLEGIRKTAGQAYQQVASLNPQAATDLESLKVARNQAQGWFNAYNRSASPLDLAKAKEARALADSLESSLETHAQDAGRTDLIPALRDARQLIAKTYTVQRAMNPATGTVDPKVLARMLQKGQPLSDGLDTVAQFASAFPTVAKTAERVGSPDAHNMKAMASLMSAAVGGASAGPLGLAAGVIPLAAPPIARSIMFRPSAQQALVQQMPQGGRAAQLAAMLQNQAALEQAIRTVPVTGAALTGP